MAVDFGSGLNHSTKNQINLVRIADISVHLKQTLKMPTKKDQFNLPEQLSIFGGATLTLDSNVDKKLLLKLLNNASHVCPSCGDTFSNPYSSSAASLFATFHMGHCDICNHHTSVTSTRDYDYLLGGKKALEELLSKKQKNNKKYSNFSIDSFLSLCEKKGV